jgi:YjbE family integral membrane protein
MLELFSEPQFWVGLAQITLVNIVLSGDNAVVIALAARSLPRPQQKKAIIWGSAAAIVMRIVLTIAAMELLRLPYLKLVGSLFLFYIAVGLLIPESGEGEGHTGKSTLWAAIRTILWADLIMSLDNVLGVAAAANGDLLLLVLGLLISIPLIIFGSTLILKLMERFPVIITLGAALLGYVAGEMLVTDPAYSSWIEANLHVAEMAVPFIGAVLVVAVGKWLALRATRNHSAASDRLHTDRPTKVPQ